MKFDMGKILAQAQKVQAEMQAKMQQAREKLRSTTVIGQAGGGLVEVEMNGEFELIRITIKPSALSELGLAPSQKTDKSTVEAKSVQGAEASQNHALKATAEELSDLIFAAVNSALTQAKKLHDEVMSEVSGVNSMNIPGIGDIMDMLR